MEVIKKGIEEISTNKEILSIIGDSEISKYFEMFLIL